ncbi:uncharacterized protein P884DRAFT_268084 [Thermothelomyces heterothallicus CBS 202.75]|uniref:uncharacterized protein n=1 Tax=Thermothelomyces heterothallicus CBS 202.75 TaxID=1149848 RepID=UPI003742E14E
MQTDAITRVSDRIKHDHRELEEYHDNIKGASRDDDKVKWQNQELVVYQAMEKHVPDGVRLAEKDRSEHQQVKEKRYEFQSMGPADPTFTPAIDSLWETLSQHIREEEEEDLPALEKVIDTESSEAMARSFDRTKHFVPTRSYPGAPDRPPFETFPEWK